MNADRVPAVREAVLRLGDGTDPAAVGAAVTGELCGHWEHAGGCRWPHNNEIHVDRLNARFRTLFVAPPAEVDDVHQRVEKALRSGAWSVVSCRSRPLLEDERELAARLARTPLPTA